MYQLLCVFCRRMYVCCVSIYPIPKIWGRHLGTELLQKCRSYCTGIGLVIIINDVVSTVRALMRRCLHLVWNNCSRQTSNLKLTGSISVKFKKDDISACCCFPCLFNIIPIFEVKCELQEKVKTLSYKDIFQKWHLPCIDTLSMSLADYAYVISACDFGFRPTQIKYHFPHL